MIVKIPELVRDANMQTVLGAYSIGAPKIDAKNVRIPVAGGSLDGLFFSSDLRSRAACIVLHGITGAASDATMVRVANKLRARGVHALGVTMRGGPGSRDCDPPAFHAASSEDIRSTFSYLLERHDRVAAFGISLGAHLLLLACAEWETRAPNGIRGIAALSPPLDVNATEMHLAEPGGRLYQRYMVRRLIDRAKHARARLHPEVFANVTTRVKSVRDYNRELSVPVSGSRDLSDYHARTDLTCRMHQIVPRVMLLQAEDDPVVPVSATRAAQKSMRENIECTITRFGGHVGFIGKNRPFGDPDRRWGENRAIDFLCASLC